MRLVHTIFKSKKKFVQKEPQLGLFFSNRYGNVQTELLLNLDYEVGKTVYKWMGNMEAILANKKASKVESAYVIPEGAIILNIIPRTFIYEISEKESVSLVKSALFESYPQVSDLKSFRESIDSLQWIWKVETGLSKETTLEAKFYFEEGALANSFLLALEKEIRHNPYIMAGVSYKSEGKEVRVIYGAYDNKWAGPVALSLLFNGGVINVRR